MADDLAGIARDDRSLRHVTVDVGQRPHEAARADVTPSVITAPAADPALVADLGRLAPVGLLAAAERRQRRIMAIDLGPRADRAS